MQCREAQVQFSAYIDRELDAESNNGLSLHLQQCPHCREALNELEALDGKLRRLPRVELGPEFSSRLITLIRQREFSKHPGVPGRLPGIASPSRLLDSLRDWFGFASQAGNDPLKEFSDFPPLSIGSVYFSIFGQSGD
jgi:anti-sigma factor RsiW